jgi:predicted ATPase/class 3 adenylate cyclase
MKCPKCQTKNPDERKFCRECGAKLLLVCPQCGSENLPSDKFCGECGHNLTLPSEPTPKDLSFDEKLDKIQRYLPKGLTEKILSQRDKIEGERKQVTVMFCDMEGFTSLVESLGPEEAYSVMDHVYEILIHKVHDYEGTVNEMTGDGIMALFGAPIALEDAPQRAIRSAMAIHREMARFSDKLKREQKGIPPLKMRVGINTGPVVVGTLGNDLRVEFKAVGDTVNLASRMEELADPGTTYVTGDTFKLTEGLFRFEALGEKAVKGSEEPVTVYRAVAPSTRRTRFDVSTERGLTPFVGRERELGLLLDGFQRAKAGRGQAISIMSEAGVGKSRLLYEFRKAISNENATFLEGRCLSYSRGASYHPVIDILKSNFDIHEGDGDTEIREKIKRGLKILGIDEASTLPYLLELLSVKDSGIDEIPMSPEARKDRIIEALKQIVLKGSEIRPLIMAYEDLHWIDKSSEDQLKHLLESIPGAKVVLLFTYRPEFVHTWGGKSFHSQVTLNRLSNRESLTMISHLLGTEEIDSDLEDFVLEKTEGVPLFIEEFIISLKDLRIIERKDNKYHLAKNIQNVAIPSTIQDVIMARVDSLPEGAKKVLQIGSVIEREFGHNLVKLVTRLPEKELLSHLSVLKDSELLYERGIYTQSTYIFKHAVIKDVSFQSLLKSTRQKYHRQIAQVIEQHFPETAEGHPEVLGHHFTEADLVEQAIPYWQNAGEIAIRRSANLEAIDHLSMALEMLKTLPERPERMQQELELQIALGPALMAVKGYTVLEVEKAYARARELCQKLGETPQLFAILRGLWGFYIVRGELQTAHELGKQCLALAKRAQRPALFLWTYYMLGMTLFHFGELTSARDYFEKGIALYDIKKRRSQRALQDPGVACLSYTAVALWLLGYPDQALKKSREALTLAHNLSHPFSLAYALSLAAAMSQLYQNVQETQKRAESANALCIEQGIPYWLAYGPILRGWALTEQGQRDEGIRQTRQGLAAYSATGAELAWPYFLSLLAEVYVKEIKAEEGFTVLAKALAIVDKTRERWWEPELHRLKGKLILGVSSAHYAEAEACFHQAIAIARQQRAKSLELRASMSLSRLWHKQGKKEEARKMLSEVYGWFTEGFDVPDLKEAKGLLNELV